MNYRLVFSAAILVGLAGGAQAGMMEICKDDTPIGSLSGVVDFTIAGQAGIVAVPVGACSPAMQLPDGFASVTELPQPGSLLLGVSAFPDDRLISFDPTTDTAVVRIVPGDTSTETVLTFTNAPAANVPEPGTGWMFGLGLTCWAFCRKISGRTHPRKWRIGRDTSRIPPNPVGNVQTTRSPDC